MSHNLWPFIIYTSINWIVAMLINLVIWLFAYRFVLHGEKPNFGGIQIWSKSIYIIVYNICDFIAILFWILKSNSTVWLSSYYTFSLTILSYVVVYFWNFGISIGFQRLLLDIQPNQLTLFSNNYVKKIRGRFINLPTGMRV